MPPRENAPCAIAIPPKDSQDHPHPLFETPQEQTSWDQQIFASKVGQSLIDRGVQPKPDLEGKWATVKGKVVTIEFLTKPGLRGSKVTVNGYKDTDKGWGVMIKDGNLSDVTPGVDFLLLARSLEEGKTFLIVQCNPQAGTVTLAEDPGFDEQFLNWAVYTKTVMKTGLQGNQASANGCLIEIEHPKLKDVNPGIDVLWLSQATGEGKLFTVEACDPETHRVTLTEDPKLDGLSSLAWAIYTKPVSRVEKYTDPVSRKEKYIDCLWLGQEGKGQVFSIESCNPLEGTVTLTVAPAMATGASDWKIGLTFDQYEAFLPQPPTQPDQEYHDLPKPSLDQGIVYAQLGISAFSKHPNRPNDQRLFSESPIEGPREVFRVRRQPPAPPGDVPYPDGDIFATRADYHGRSFYTYQWPAPPNSSLKTHGMRALDDAVFKLDWLMRTTRTALDPKNPRHEKYFPENWDLNRKQTAASQLNAIQSFGDYSGLSSDARTLLEYLPGNNKKTWNSGLQNRDWEIRRTRISLSASDTQYFPNAWNDPIRRNGIANKLNAIIGLLSGEAAMVDQAIVALDNTLDLSRVRPHRDTLWLAADQANANRHYRIIEVDAGNHRVTLDKVPSLGASSSKWVLYLDEYNFSKNDPLALNNDDLRVLAGLPGNEDAFTQITIEPLHSGICELKDTLDGKSRNRYFYRSAFVDRVQNKSGLSRATPPIYLPKVTPPQTPVVTKVLGGDRQITLRWVSSREPDLREYWIYRTENQEAARDIRLMLRLPEPIPGDDTFERLPEITWTDRTIPKAGTYYYRLVAVDSTGNQSVSSPPLVGRAFDDSRPLPPTWNPSILSSNPNEISLSWSLPTTDLSCLV